MIRLIKCFLIFLPLLLEASTKTLLITCATGALGSETARLLAKDYNLILTGRNVTTLQNLQKELKAAHPWNYEICTLDYSRSSSIAQFSDQMKGKNLAGLVLMTPRPQFTGTSLFQEESIWLDALRTTYIGPLEALKAVSTSLSHSSKIVLIAGTTSVHFQPASGPTGVIRRMWTAAAKTLSHELGQQGITVNTLSPGVVMTPYHQDRIQKKADAHHISFDEQMEQEVSNIPLHRHAKAKEVAQTIQFLLSEQSDFINGINLILDGGLSPNY